MDHFYHNSAPADVSRPLHPRLTSHLQEHDVDAKPFHKKVRRWIRSSGGGEPIVRSLPLADPCSPRGSRCRNLSAVNSWPMCSRNFPIRHVVTPSTLHPSALLPIAHVPPFLPPSPAPCVVSGRLVACASDGQHGHGRERTGPSKCRPRRAGGAKPPLSLSLVS